jgi:hypothetical protein
MGRFLSSFWSRPRPCPLVVLDCTAPDGFVSLAYGISQSSGLGPCPVRCTGWALARQVFPRQPTLAELYQQLRSSLTERQKAWLFAHAHQYQRHLK